LARLARRALPPGLDAGVECAIERASRSVRDIHTPFAGAPPDAMRCAKQRSQTQSLE
jgi:hypothetical protein